MKLVIYLAIVILLGKDVNACIQNTNCNDCIKQSCIFVTVDGGEKCVQSDSETLDTAEGKVTELVDCSEIDPKDNLQRETLISETSTTAISTSISIPTTSPSQEDDVMDSTTIRDFDDEKQQIEIEEDSSLITTMDRSSTSGANVNVAVRLNDREGIRIVARAGNVNISAKLEQSNVEVYVVSRATRLQHDMGSDLLVIMCLFVYLIFN